MISAVDGTAGIGKTTLAVHWAHRVKHRFPDGALHVNLRGYGPGDPATPGEVLDGFLRALGIPAEAMPVGVEAQSGLYRSLLDGRRVLIVLDNANSADQVRPLLPGTSGCVVVVTSRDSLTGLVITESATRLTLDLLSEHEALELVTDIVGRPRVTAELGAVTELIRLCARLPLALRIAAGRVAAGPHTVVDVAADLADEQYRLDALSWGGDERGAVRAVFDWSYQRLTAEEARLFRRLGMHPGPDFGVHATAALADLAVPVARRLLERLDTVHLIESVARDRYRFHDLLRAYAVDQVRRYDSAADRDHARESILTLYTHAAHVCDELLFPAHFRFPLHFTAPARPMVITDRAHALDWAETERTNLLAALRHAANHDMHRHVIHLTEGARFLLLQGSWDELLEICDVGLVAAQGCGDSIAEVVFRSRRGEAFMTMGRLSEASTDFYRAWTLVRESGDRVHRAGALRDLGWVCHERERFGEALQYLQEAHSLSEGVDTGRMEGLVEHHLGRTYTGLGDYRKAIEHGERSLSLRRGAGDLTGEPGALRHLACAWQGLGEHHKAITLCQEAIALGRTIGDPAHNIAEPLDTLAKSLHHTGRLTEAIQCWHEAAALFTDCGHLHRAAEIREHLHTFTSPVAVDRARDADTP